MENLPYGPPGSFHLALGCSFDSFRFRVFTIRYLWVLHYITVPKSPLISRTVPVTICVASTTTGETDDEFHHH
jgi:hypothetical protein